MTEQSFDFVKMHGLGNDFIVLDGLTRTIDPDRLPLELMADRRRGIGCDQLLLIEPTTRSDCDWQYRIFNADGSEVQQCGNGVRCVALYLWDHHAPDRRDLTLESRAGQIRVTAQTDDRVCVNMGEPVFENDRIPVMAEHEGGEYFIESDSGTHQLSVLSMGNPHAVLFVEDVDAAPVQSLGPELERASAFPERCNIGFAQVVDRSHIRLRVWERGVGETQACGSGACAAMVAARTKGLVSSQAKVELPGGCLEIQWHKAGSAVMMTGEAKYAYQGTYHL